jgi:hypothetical protein
MIKAILKQFLNGCIHSGLMFNNFINGQQIKAQDQFPRFTPTPQETLS